MTRARRSPAAANARTLAELAVAAPQVVAHRVTRMALAGPVLSSRDRREFTGMVVEKQLAFAQAWWAMAIEVWQAQQRMALAWFGGPAVSAREAHDAVLAKGLAPIHRKAVSNARRLAKTRLR